jgi:signal transduction histidine kinase
MRRAALIFLAAILLPCLVLAWLAIRSEQDQQVILQHQQAIIDQGVTDSLALNVRTQMDGVLADFVRSTQQLLTNAGPPLDLAQGFDQKIRNAWPLAQVGFAVDLQGTIYAPARSDGIPAQTFRKENGSFLSNREDAEVYSNAQNQVENILQNARAVTDEVTNQNVKSRSMTATDGLESAPSTVAAPTVPAPAASAPMSGGAALSPQTETSPTETQRSLSVPQDMPNGSAAPASPPAEPVAASAAVANRDSDEMYQDKTKAAVHGAAARAAKDQDTQMKALPAAPADAAPEDATTAKSVDESAASASITTASPATPAALRSEQDAAKKPSPATSSGSAIFAPDASSPAADAEAGAMPPTPNFSLAGTQQIARIARQVAPQENTRAPDAALSNVIPAQSDFRQLIGQSTNGSIARFLEDKLCLLVWSLPAHDSIVFGAQLDQGRLVDKLRSLVQPEVNRSSLDSSFGGRANYCLALLDDKGQPVALSQAGFHTDWKHPFVATEIGSVLPHWEAALYLSDPNQVSHSARVLHFTIGLIILLLIVAILAGGSLIGTDVNRQMRLAQQKTDFVSNVSHELKTPLTSIRMFADMLAEGRVAEPEKQATYLRIISAESARLTRLINNVLDFARMERGAPAGEHHPCDLVEAAREVVETCLPHLQGASVSLAFEVEAESLPLLGDRDALSQIILNLISNAEKYGGGEIVVRVRRQDGPSGPLGCVDVLDRGPGIAAKKVETAFSPFQRLDDSLASGIPGSGLGLTLARRMARAHGGDITYQPRAGGGSCFTLALPLSEKKS